MKLKMIVASTALIFSCNTFAFGCDDSINRIDGLNNEAKQAMVVACEQQKLELAKTVNSKPEQLSTAIESIDTSSLNKMSEIAKVASQTVKEVAKELNVAANEFVKTPVGLLVAATAIWYVAGDSISGLAGEIWSVIIGTLGILFGYLILGRMRKRLAINNYTDTVVKTWFGLSEKVVRTPNYYSDLGLDSNGGTASFILFLECVVYVIMFFIIIV